MNGLGFFRQLHPLEWVATTWKIVWSPWATTLSYFQRKGNIEKEFHIKQETVIGRVSERTDSFDNFCVVWILLIRVLLVNMMCVEKYLDLEPKSQGGSLRFGRQIHPANGSCIAIRRLVAARWMCSFASGVVKHSLIWFPEKQVTKRLSRICLGIPPLVFVEGLEPSLFCNMNNVQDLGKLAQQVVGFE